MPIFATAFKASTVAEYYRYRPPYPDQVFETLLKLVPETTPAILDAGCGPGKLARGLVEHVDRVDAVDFSAEMIRVGQSLPNGRHPNLHWQCAAVEEATLHPPYGLIVAGASLHWMDWQVVLPRFRQTLAPDGVMALVGGDEPSGAPWLAERKALIAEYSTYQDYRPFDMVAELVQQGYFEQIGEEKTAPLTVRQTIEDFLKSDHLLRASLTTDGMGSGRAAEYDAKLQAVLEPHSVEGRLSYEVTARIVWGKSVA